MEAVWHTLVAILQGSAVLLFYIGAFVNPGKLKGIKSWEIEDDDDRQVLPVIITSGSNVYSVGIQSVAYIDIDFTFNVDILRFTILLSKLSRSKYQVRS